MKLIYFIQDCIDDKIENIRDTIDEYKEFYQDCGIVCLVANIILDIANNFYEKNFRTFFHGFMYILFWLLGFLIVFVNPGIYVINIISIGKLCLTVNLIKFGLKYIRKFVFYAFNISEDLIEENVQSLGDFLSCCQLVK